MSTVIIDQDWSWHWRNETVGAEFAMVALLDLNGMATVMQILQMDVLMALISRPCGKRKAVYTLGRPFAPPLRNVDWPTSDGWHRLGIYVEHWN